jgi:hypothetical protein
VKVRDVYLKNQACWGLFILYSENVLVQNLTIRADHNIISSDGIDVDSSRNVHITGATLTLMTIALLSNPERMKTAVASIVPPWIFSLKNAVSVTVTGG